MDVLEAANGTGLSAVNIASFVQSIEAIDYAPKILEADLESFWAKHCKVNVYSSRRLKSWIIS